MSVVNLTCEQKELVEKAVSACGLTQCDIIANVGSQKGDNYLGIISTVKVEEKKGEKVLHFILKSAHSNENFRKSAPIHKTFLREDLLYSKILPELVSYQHEAALSDPFTGCAKYYGSILEEPKEAILMQNLKEDGYEMWDRMIPMNNDLIAFVFKEYARLHAASFALRTQRPSQFEELTKDILTNVFEGDDFSQERWSQFIGMYFGVGFDAVKASPKATSILEKLQSKIAQLFEEIKIPEKDRGVVLHGDCWCNNMLFKFKENTKIPLKVCFIDWQLSKVGSPIMDLSYFFAVCASKDTFPNLMHYLKVYHEVLSQNLKEFGCEPEQIMSFEQLTEEWKRFSWFGVFLALMVIKLMLSASEEAPNFSEAKTDESLLNNITDLKISKSSEYKIRIIELVEFMSDNNYI